MTEPYYQDESTCACGCGGTPSPGRRFISHHNLRVLGPRTKEHREALSRAAARAWATKRGRMPLGARRQDSNGYWLVKVREGGGRWDKEHVIVAERQIGRRLLPDEHVHHINGVKTDNRPENLYVCTRAQHSRAHGSFAALLPSLVEDGSVVFDRTIGRYSRG